MTATLTFRGRLPGVAVDAVTPPTQPPIRLDVAGFVGFAERGPLDLAVAVDSELDYTSVFGGDLVLAQDNGQPVYAQLPAAVQAFFDNGGRRCYVVRVAGRGARPGRWTVPGLQVWQPGVPVDTAAVLSAWPGGWSAGTTLLTQLLVQPLPCRGPYVRVSTHPNQPHRPGVLSLAPEAITGLQPGDLVRLELQDAGGAVLFARVSGVDRAGSAIFTDLELGMPDKGTPASADQMGLPAQLTVSSAQLQRFDLVVRQQRPDGSKQLDRLTDLAFGAPATTRPLLVQQLRVTGPYVPVSTDPSHSPTPGVLPLAAVAGTDPQPGDLVRLELQGAGGRVLFARVSGLDGAGSAIFTDLELGLSAADVPGLPAQLTVSSAQLLRLDLVARKPQPDGTKQPLRLAGPAFGAPATTLSARPWWGGALQPADDDTPDPTLCMTLRQDPDTMNKLTTGLAVPIGMSGDGSGAPGGLLQKGDDKLGTFDPHWFIDPQLSSDTVLSLTTNADQLTALSRTPQRLRGMHALLGVEEVAMLAAPDATQRGWSPAPQPPDEPPPQPPPPAPPDWSHFRCCPDTAPTPATQQSTPQKPTAPALPQLQAVGDYDQDPLIDVQSALITLCAARADAVALLNVPQHYDVAATLAWAARITSIGAIGDGAGGGVPPLSYAAMWHPWISTCTGLDAGHPVLRDLPPDGTVAGMIAARENARGVWVAPAGIPLYGPVRLAAPTALTTGDRRQLFDAHANLVQQRPGVFTTLSAHTLSGNPQLLQLSVRRLLILLRKICLQLGERYTFEVNNDRFRQLVRMRFDRILSSLTDRGALQAFRVDIAGGLNTAEDQDAGRFVVALQVAPTSPVEFITVTLVRSGEGLLDVVEG